jgi:hypothetical protein
VYEGGLLDVGDDEVVVAGAGAGGAVPRGLAGEGVEAVDGGCEGGFLGGREVCPGGVSRVDGLVRGGGVVGEGRGRAGEGGGGGVVYHSIRLR